MPQAMIIASSEDTQSARRIEAALREGAQAAVAPQPPDLGNGDMRAGAEAAIRGAEALVLTISPAALRDDWVKFAAKTARDAGVTVIPIVLTPVEPEALLALSGGAAPIPGGAQPFDSARDIAAVRRRLSAQPTALIVAASADSDPAAEMESLIAEAGLATRLFQQPSPNALPERETVAEAVAGASMVVLVLTQAAMRSPWVRMTAEAARMAQAKLAPVLLQEIDDAALLYLTGGADPLALEPPELEDGEEDGAAAERALGVFEPRHAAELAGRLAPREQIVKSEEPSPPMHEEAAPVMDAMEREPEPSAAPPGLDAPASESPAPQKKTAVLTGSRGLGVDEGAGAPASAPGAMIRRSSRSEPMNAADEPVAAEAPPRADRRRGVEDAEERSAPSASPFRAAKLFENAPRSMRVGHSQEVTVRIARDDSAARGMTGSVSAHDIIAASAMTVTLDDPSFGYAIRPLTPATQWVDREALAQVGLGLEGQPAEWRWSVEPLKTGVRPLVIRASARVSDASGASADAGLPEQKIEIRVGVDPSRVAKDVVRWTLFAVAAGVLGHYGVEIVQTIQAFLG